MKAPGFIRQAAIIAATILAALLSFQTAFAASPAVQQAREAAKQSIERADQGSVFSPAEFKDRLAAAVSIVNLTSAEAKDAVSKLTLLESGDPQFISSINALLLWVRGFEHYADLVSAQLARPSIGEEQLQQIAGSFKQLRENIYDPTMHQVFDALLLAQGQEIFATALHRLEKVGSDVSYLQGSNGVQANILLPHLEVARKQVERARIAYNSAYELFVDNQELLRDLLNAPEVSFMKSVTLTGGVDGDFTCIPQVFASAATKCLPVFKTQNGLYYLLITSDGKPLKYSAHDVYRVQGQLVFLDPIFRDETIAGTLFVDSLNLLKPADPTDDQSQPTSTAGIPSGASVLEAVLGKQPTKTVQFYVTAEVNAIKLAYNEFFLVIKLSKQLPKK